MAENEDSKNEEQSSQPPPEADLMTSVTMAFNLGVSANQSAANVRSVAELAPELGQQIYDNLTQAYGGRFEEEHLMANTEFFLQIALLGYIIPSVCAFEEDFKNRLFALIEAKAKLGSNDGDPKIETPPDSNIIIP
ncbi:MAG: hypothetical protein ACR2NC_00430 [Thermodesulfobacteriota bacterium]